MATKKIGLFEFVYWLFSLYAGIRREILGQRIKGKNSVIKLGDKTKDDVATLFAVLTRNI